ncbi:MAG: Rieske (2Fe-2S) protein [Bacteroidota bacterium]
MNRNEFLKSCAYACVSGVALASILQSCKTSKMLTVGISGADILVDTKEFEIRKKEQLSYRKYIILQNEQLNFPICVYRLSESEYTALNLQCTHQGAELQVFGDKLVCPAHGSEFNNRGQVESGPAAKSLRTFPVQLKHTQLKISLV